MARVLTETPPLAEPWSWRSATRGQAYEGLREALRHSPPAVVAQVAESGLRGRGGAGFPTGQKWGFLRPQPDQPVYLLCNGDESEPGTFKDRHLLEHYPHLVLEGVAIAAYAIQARRAYIYLRGEYAAAAAALRQALDEAAHHDVFGAAMLGVGPALSVHLQTGAGAYICGEETGLIESLEGHRAYPRVRPPFPALRGFLRSPTVVNNVETLANLPWIMRHGPAAYAALGVPDSAGTKLISVSGHVSRPGVYEVEMGYPLADLLREEAGGLLGGHALKAVIPGGTSVPVLTAAECEGLRLDYASMRRAGTMLGSGGMIVFDETASMPRALLGISHFYATESCGECTPCREGTGWMEWILERLLAGQGRPDDLDRLLRICGNVEGHTICGLGDAAVQPVRSFLTKFRAEFEALLPPAPAATPDWQRHGHGPRSARHGPLADEAARSQPVAGPRAARY